MNGHEFAAMGTGWSIVCDAPWALSSAEALVRDAEARLSRFRPDSALSRLNRCGEALDPVLAAVTARALELRQLTEGAFDPTLGRELAAWGYDRSFDALRRAGGRPEGRPAAKVWVSGDTVRLVGGGALDLGGIAKGWAVDRVAELLLEGGATRVLVDGGGDLRGAGGDWAVGVGDDMALTLSDCAVATSSTRHRRWLSDDGRPLHHILNPRTGAPAVSTVDTVTVVAADAATADALATATLVDPERRLPALADLGAWALVHGTDGAWWMTGSPPGPR